MYGRTTQIIYPYENAATVNSDRIRKSSRAGREPVGNNRAEGVSREGAEGRARGSCSPLTTSSFAVAAAALLLLPKMGIAGNWTARNVTELIAAINAANAASGVNTLTLAPGKTFTLTAVNDTTDGPNGLPVIAANNKLIIRGNGATITRSKAAVTPAFRLFDVASGASLTLENLALANGLVVGDTGMDACGGAILAAEAPFAATALPALTALYSGAIKRSAAPPPTPLTLEPIS